MNKAELQKRLKGFFNQDSDGKTTVVAVIIKLIEPISIVKGWSKSNKKQINLLVPNPFKICNEKIGGKLLVNYCVSIRFKK